MSIWLNFLPIEIQDVETLIEPTDEIKEGETIIGVVSDGLKKMWTLFRTMKRAADLSAVELKYGPASAEERGKVSEQITKARAMEFLFWIAVLDEFQLWGRTEQHDLRVGWQVVEFKQTQVQFPFGFLPYQQ